MNFNRKAILGGSILLIALIIVVLKLSSHVPSGNSQHPGTQTVPRAKTRSMQAPKPDPGPSRVVLSDETQGTSTADPAKARDAAIEKMQDASTRYDAAELPVIQPYLTSPDPELRAAAVDAMIVLGDASAGPMLRKAAKSLASTEEAEKMTAAADYVELPSGDFKEISEQSRKRREEQEPAPNHPK